MTSRPDDGAPRARPRKGPRRRPGEWLMTLLARVLVRVFFRTVEVDSVDRIPPSGPVVLVANHTNGLVDGLLLMAALGRCPRFLGKSTLFRIPVLWPFLKLAGVIPVCRAIDAVAGDGNISAFATSRTVLAHGGVVAVFPEGISHDERRLQPLKTGAARIALETAFDDGIDDVVIVAVGLTYDAKARFRSRALVDAAPPIGLDGLADSYRADPHAAVRTLTGAIAAQLSSVSPTYSSWAEADLYARIAEVLVRTPGSSLPADTRMTAQTEVASRLAAAQPDTEHAPDDLRAAFATYQRDLDLLGLDDAQVTADYPRGRLPRAILWAVVKVVVAFPVAAIGVAVHVIPFEIVKQLAKKPNNEGIKATVKVIGCFVCFLLTYIGVGILVADAFGGWAGFAAAVVAPWCGYVAVRVNERVRRVDGVLAGARRVRERRDILDSVMEHRAAVTAAAQIVLTHS